jgi:hypothetical protein
MSSEPQASPGGSGTGNPQKSYSQNLDRARTTYQNSNKQHLTSHNSVAYFGNRSENDEKKNWLEKGKSFRVTREELDFCRKSLSEILDDKDKKKNFLEFAKNSGGKDVLIIAYENLASFEKNTKATPALLKEIAGVLWESVRSTPGAGGLNFPQDIVSSIQRELESFDRLTNLSIFLPAKEYLFDVIAARLVPSFRNEYDIETVTEESEKSNIVRSSDKDPPQDKVKTKKSSRLSLAILSPRKPDTPIRRVSDAGNKSVVISVKKKEDDRSWIDKQRKEREFNESKKGKKKKKDDRYLKTDSKKGSIKMKKAPSENSISTAHISWQDVDEKLALFREPKVSNSEKLAADLLAELDLSMDDKIVPELVTRPQPKLDDSRKKPSTSRRQAQRDHWVSVKSKSVTSIPSPPPPSSTSRPASTKISKTDPARQPLNRSTSATGLSKLIVQSSPQRRSNEIVSNTSSDNSATSTPVKHKSMRERSSPLPLICSAEIEVELSPQPDIDRELKNLENNLEIDPLEELLGPRKKDNKTAYESFQKRLHQSHYKVQELSLSANQSEELGNVAGIISGSGNLSDSVGEDFFKNEVEQLLDLFEKENEDESDDNTQILNNKESELDFIEIPPIVNKRANKTPIIPPNESSRVNKSPVMPPNESRVNQLSMPPVEANRPIQSPSKLHESGKWVVLRKLGAQRGGVKVRLPSTLSELIKIGSEQLNIKGVKVREYQTEAAILDIDAIESDIVYLTTAEEEKMF